MPSDTVKRDAIDQLIDMLEKRDAECQFTSALMKKRIIQTFLELELEDLYAIDLRALRNFLGLPALE